MRPFSLEKEKPPPQKLLPAAPREEGKRGEREQGGLLHSSPGASHQRKHTGSGHLAIGTRSQLQTRHKCWPRLLQLKLCLPAKTGLPQPCPLPSGWPRKKRQERQKMLVPVKSHDSSHDSPSPAVMAEWFPEPNLWAPLGRGSPGARGERKGEVTCARDSPTWSEIATTSFSFPSFPRTHLVKGLSTTSYTFQDVCPEVLGAHECPLSTAAYA